MLPSSPGSVADSVRKRTRRRSSMSNDSSYFSSGKKPKIESEKGSSKKTPRRSSQQNAPRSAIKTGKTKKDEKEAIQSTPVSSPSQVTLSPATVVNRPLPTFKGTDRERLVACIQALKGSYTVDISSFDPDRKSRFSYNLDRVQDFLGGVLQRFESGPADQVEPSSSALYVCGVPGIGKTMGIKWCCENAIDNSDLDVNWVHINAGRLQNMPAILAEFATALGYKSSVKKNTIRRKLQAKTTTLIAVVDEIDLLIPNHDGKESKTVKIVQELLDWANDGKTRFVLIGVSNSSANTKYTRLQELGKVSPCIIFQIHHRVKTILLTFLFRSFSSKKP